MTLILGPARRFVPICIRHPYGFIGGPSGYVESETAKAPIIVEWEMTDEQTIIGESIRESDRAAAALAPFDAVDKVRKQITQADAAKGA